MKREIFYDQVSRETLASVIEAFAAPGYIYFRTLIERRLSEIRKILGSDFEVLFAVKANANPELLHDLAEMGLGADVASYGEMEQAIRSGFKRKSISFAGPGKNTDELQAAVKEGVTISVESLAELRQIGVIAARAKQQTRITFRVNLELELRAGLRMGKASQFGMLTSELPEAFQEVALSHGWMSFEGMHAHSGSQILDPAQIYLHFESLLDTASAYEATTGLLIPHINFGGGWGVDYFSTQSPLDQRELTAGIASLMTAARAKFARLPKFQVEPGRFLVAEAGVYVTRILYRKSVREKNFLIVDGGMHQNYVLAGGMGQVIRRPYEMDHFPGDAQRSRHEAATFDIVGCLCTPQDVLATDVRMNDPQPGDLVVFFNSGAYGVSASPTRFLLHNEPSEMMA